MVVDRGRVELERGRVGGHGTCGTEVVRLLSRHSVGQGGLAGGTVQVLLASKVTADSFVRYGAQGHCSYARAGWWVCGLRVEEMGLMVSGVGVAAVVAADLR